MTRAADTNSLARALLRDMAAAQPSTQSKWGYTRAARGQDIDRSRNLRAYFLSRAQVLAALKDSRLRGPLARRLSRRFADAFQMDRRSRDDLRPGESVPRARIPILRDDRSLLRLADRRWHVDGRDDPRGRKFGSRAGVLADGPRVFKAAARHKVAVEIDGDPSRQDLDFTLARQALKAGCLFALDSDAHSGSQLSYADTALAHARLAGIPPARIINCWDVEKLLAWAGRAWKR